MNSTRTWLDTSNSWYNKNSRSFLKGAEMCNTTPLLEEFFSKIKPKSSVLDVGCGGGRDLEIIKKRGFQASGLEPSTTLAQIARKRSECTVYNTDIEHIPHHKWDAIWCLAVFVHIPLNKWQSHLETLISRLNPDGYMLLETKAGETYETLDSQGRPLSLISKIDLKEIIEPFKSTCNIEFKTHLAPTSQGNTIAWHSLEFQKCSKL